MANDVRLIDANALDALEDLEYYYQPVRDGEAWYRVADVWACIDGAPTIAPESLRPKGRWILTNEDYEYLTCSICCGAYYTGADTFARAQDHLKFAGGYKYCPHCGADMREG